MKIAVVVQSCTPAIRASWLKAIQAAVPDEMLFYVGSPAAEAPRGD